MALRRRDLLVGLSAGAVWLLSRPGSALALGGTLPTLGEPAPEFNLEGVIPASGAEGATQGSRAGAAPERAKAADGLASRLDATRLGDAEGGGAALGPLAAGNPAPEVATTPADEAVSGDAATAGDAATVRTATVRTARLALGDFRGRWLVLYFYPRDFTSGCTLEARGFQRNLEAFHAASAEVVGVSADDTDDHAAFCGSEGLVYPLLSDPGGRVSRAYGSWLAPFSLRHTFLIDPQGVLRASWTAVRPAGHATEVLAELQRLQAGLLG